MEIIFYVLILIPLFCLGFILGFTKSTKIKTKEKTYNYYFNEEEKINDFADFLNYDGSNKKGDN